MINTLSGDRSYDKDNIRRYVTEGGRVIPERVRFTSMKFLERKFSGKMIMQISVILIKFVRIMQI